MGFKTIAKELGITYAIVQRWVRHFEREGVAGLEEKRGSFSSTLKGRPRTKEQSVEEELLRLRAENEYLIKLWELQRGQKEGKNDDLRLV
ncbi:helix-turn-helix domain-containing protein [Paenibacillus lautus]|uniref:helix-turn-helix domain-containing protein n=1 Tax=Paenibacillus lautus TaxID=1401 RepID=UPI003D27779B